MATFKSLLSPKRHMTPSELLRSLVIVVSVVLIWRGIWYMLDQLDIVLFSGNHLWSAVVGIVLGVALLYLPDRDLKELTHH